MNLFERISPLIFQTLIWIPTRIILLSFGYFKVKGLENLKNVSTSHGVIFASNHASGLDPILLPAGLPFFSRFMPMFYTSRERTFYHTNKWWEDILYSTKWFRAWGAHQVYVGQNDFDIALQKHIKILKEGKSVLIFPEGGTTKDGVIRPFKSGVIHLSLRTGAPIIPVVMKDTFRISFKQFFKRRHKLTLIFGKPIYPDHFVNSKDKVTIAEYKNDSFLLENKIKELMNL